MKKAIAVITLSLFFWVFNLKGGIAIFNEAEAVSLKAPQPALLLGLNAAPSVSSLLNEPHLSPASGGGHLCKSHVVAGLLGIFFGGFGVHYFYVGNTGMGVLFLLLFWTGVPFIIGWITGIIWLIDQDGFNSRYCRDKYERDIEY